ncbi:hypothetical protein QCA50_009535 [Cerrena zonata]|uniref:DUF659 domain-containing protein n=1 Tax=Cerrena zonata TaxID=2478898 RepID=A0AAW0G7C6_9APHY
MAPVELLPLEEIEHKISHLRKLLESLSEDLPDGINLYNFQQYAPDPSCVEDFGEEGALNRDLEVIFCPHGRVKGPPVLRERGPGLVAVAGVLLAFIRRFPHNAVLQKWVFDLTDAAEKHNSKGSDATAVRLSTPPPVNDTQNPSPSSQSPSLELKRKASKPKKKPSAKKTKVTAPVSIMDQYEDEDEPDARGPGGRPVSDILRKVSIRTRWLKDNNNDPDKVYYRCIGADMGCIARWAAPRPKGRVLAHAEHCTKIDVGLREKVTLELARELNATKTSSGAKASSSATPTGSTFRVEPGSSSPLVPATTLPRQPTVVSHFNKINKVQLQTDLDQLTLEFICVNGIPPRVLDSQQWKKLWGRGNPDYKLCSSTTFSQRVVHKAAWIKTQVIAELQRHENLTITFDGGTTRAMESVYTIHITTPDRVSFLFEGNQSSDVSHTGKHLNHVLKDVIVAVGPERFRAIGSDSTGNTTLARNLTHKDFLWIFVLPDPCHEFHNMSKDIGKIPWFSRPIKDIRLTVKHFKMSSFATSHLKSVRVEMGIPRGLSSVGKTRFNTVYFSGESVRRCEPAIKKLCQAKIVSFKDYETTKLYLPGAAATEHGLKRDYLLAILAPIAKSTTCLESSLTTVSDVFVFFLAVMCEIHDFITAPSSVPTEVKEDIRRSANRRYKRIIGSSDIYLTGFILDPRYRGSNILKDYNPLAIKTIKLSLQKGTSSGGRDKQKQGKSSSDLPEILKRAGQFLLRVLRIEYEHRKRPIANLPVHEALTRLKQQVRQWVISGYPFDRPYGATDTPQTYWKHLRATCEDAQPLATLACMILDVMPNSMAEERTVSCFSWLNAPLRANQKVSTLVRLTQVRQHYLREQGTKRIKRHPTVKFRDMRKTMESLRGSEKSMHGSEADSESESESDAEGDSDTEDEAIESDEEETPDSGKLDCEADLGVDLTSLELHDHLSDTPLISSQAQKPSQVKATRLSTAEPVLLTDADWDMS